MFVHRSQHGGSVEREVAHAGDHYGANSDVYREGLSGRSDRQISPLCYLTQLITPLDTGHCSRGSSSKLTIVLSRLSPATLHPFINQF